MAVHLPPHGPAIDRRPLELIERQSLQPTSAIDEALLFRAMAGGSSVTTRTVGCACGGQICAIADDHIDIAEAVLGHNRGPQHRAWSNDR